MRLDSIRNFLLAFEQLTVVEQEQLIQAGIVDASQMSITWNGHAFIDNIRDSARWDKVKKSAQSFEDAIKIADKYARDDVGLL